MKRGFTLIELLVAVLIIGVLTAMALPMYQKSVDKSRYATLMPLAKNIKDAQEAFYLGGGKYSKDLGSLDVRVPGNPSGNTATLSDGTTVEISNTDGTGYVKMGKENLNNYYVMYQDRSSSYPGEIHCEALSDNDRANELCQNLGGTKIDQALTSGYTAYVLVGTGENAGGGGTLPVTKQLTSTETCTQNTASYVSNCTKYVYDDGTYVERYHEGDNQDYELSYLYDENGNRLAWLNYTAATGTMWVCSSAKEGGACYKASSISTDGMVTVDNVADTTTSPISGQEWEGYAVHWYSGDGGLEVSYGEHMGGDGEMYSIHADGSWINADLHGETETDTWSIVYNENYYPEPVNIRAPEETFTAITAAWAAAGYSSDLTALRSWMEGEQQRIVAEYCALDPQHGYCQ